MGTTRVVQAHKLTARTRKSWICLALLPIVGCGVPPSGNSTLKDKPTVQPTPAPTGSNLGYLWLSSDSTLRPIVGIPGAAHIESPVLSNRAFATAAVALRTGLALLEDNAGNLALLELNPGQEPQTIVNSLPQGVQIGFAPAGEQAVVFFPGGKGIIRVSGLPNQPQSSKLAVNGSGTLSGGSISDTGTLLLSYQLAEGATSIVAIGNDGASSPILALARFGGMTFLTGADDALVADSAKNVLYLVRRVGPSATVEPLASGRDGLNTPNRVVASYDSHWAIVSNQGDSNLVRIDVTRKTAALPILCSCTPTELTQLAGNAVFQLTGSGSSPIWIVDASLTQPKTYFIPPLSVSVQPGVR